MIDNEKFTILVDLILLDVIMPGMSGFEPLAALKNSDITRDIPVICITGMDSAEVEQGGKCVYSVCLRAYHKSTRQYCSKLTKSNAR